MPDKSYSSKSFATAARADDYVRDDVAQTVADELIEVKMTTRSTYRLGKEGPVIVQMLAGNAANALLETPGISGIVEAEATHRDVTWRATLSFGPSKEKPCDSSTS